MPSARPYNESRLTLKKVLASLVPPETEAKRSRSARELAAKATPLCAAANTLMSVPFVRHTEMVFRVMRAVIDFDNDGLRMRDCGRKHCLLDYSKNCSP